MDIMGYMFGFISFIWCLSLSNKLNKLKRIIKDNGLIDNDKTSLREILENNKGSYGKIKLEDTDFEVSTQYCLIDDVDEDWVLIKTEKKEVQKLIRIESIKSIQFKS